jgi:beta-fructofuranosidase
MQVPDGRRIVWGWVNGFPGGHGWNGCLSLPRVLSLSRDGRLEQRPAPQLAKLRGTPVKWKNILLDASPKIFALPRTNTLEIEADIDLEAGSGVIVGFKEEPISFLFDGAKLKFLNDEIPFTLAGKDKKLRARIFVDRSVLEVFVNDELCATKVIQPISVNDSLELSATGGGAKARLIEAWPMKTIW